ncbi:MAG: adenylate/guanylate cyclase domain-containing protein [Nitrosomonadales bacterium]|nr:adenylate/guanylate cyclase domain-containing protein [Nitrosomonadales bacterium]
MSSAKENAAVLFADISGSTALYEKLGNDRALQLVTLTLGILTQRMAAHHGTLVKTIGDEIMCVFPRLTDAFAAACAMQQAVEEQRPGGEQPIHVRIGLHYGEVVLEKGDVFGDTVNTAARIAAITRARQIMTSQQVVDMLPEELRFKTRPVMRTMFRGKEKAFDVCLILWEKEDTMSTRIGMSAFRKPAESRHELMLRYHQQVLTVGEALKTVVLGRGNDCDMVIMSKLASRLHARIEYNFGKFLLNDQSVNGTYLRFSDGQVILLNQQQIVLHGAGTISLGEPYSEEPAELIEFLLQ